MTECQAVGCDRTDVNEYAASVPEGGCAERALCPDHDPFHVEELG